MKKFVWSERRVAGGRRVGALPPLPDVAGRFQDAAVEPNDGAFLSRFSRDVAVLAYRTATGDDDLTSYCPTITSNTPGLDTAALIDGKLGGAVKVAGTRGQPAWVRFSFDRPRTLRALTYAGPLGRRTASGRTASAASAIGPPKECATR